MTVIINGTTGITNVNGSAAAPAETGTDTDTGIVYGTNTVTLATNGTAGLVQDASQNIDVGLTPSTWSAGKALEVGFAGTGIFTTTASQTIITGNTNYNGSFKYSSANPASYYQQYQGAHYLYGAPSGSSGAAVTFTQLLAVSKDNTLVLQGGAASSGTGIAFPATQLASADANTLDDYEEGTFNATITGAISNPTVSYLDRLGIYTKVGRLVTVTLHVSTSSISGGSGDLRISGLPFASAFSTWGAGSVAYASITGASTPTSTMIAAGNTYMEFWNGISVIVLGSISAADLYLSITYSTS